MGWLKKPRHQDSLEREFDRELRFHIDELTERYVSEGMTRQEAHRQAILEFGGKEQMIQQLREVHQIPILETLAMNLRFAWRLIRKSPVFSAVVVLTLTLGIGANSAVFSVIDAVLLRPLPFPHDDELMLLRQYNPKEKSPQTSVAPVRLEDWNRMNSTFQSISGYYTEDDSEVSGPLPEKLSHALVAPRFLQVLGVSPALGRDFTPDEERFGGPGAVLISYRLWQRRFAGDPNVVGKSLRFDKTSLPIVGVMPAAFSFPDRGIDVWSPVSPDAPVAQSRESTWYTVIGRFKPGVDVEKAGADVNNVQTELGEQFPRTDAKLAVKLVPLKDNTVRSSRRSLWVLFGSVSLLLLIACTNIAALLLARMTEREHEISIRFSLGATRRTVIAQLLTEVFLLAVAGSLAGLSVAAAAPKVFRILTPDLPRVEEITLDWRIAWYSLICALAVTFVCGMLPALRGTRRGIAGSLAKSSKTQVSGRNPIQWALVAIR